MDELETMFAVLEDELNHINTAAEWHGYGSECGGLLREVAARITPILSELKKRLEEEN